MAARGSYSSLQKHDITVAQYTRMLEDMDGWMDGQTTKIDPSSWSDISHFSGCYDDRADTEHMGGWGSGRLNRPLPNLSGYSLNIQRVERLSRREMC